MDQSTPIRSVKGIGANRAEGLEAAGIATVDDLLRHSPFRYEDRTNFKQVRDLQPGEEVLVLGRIAASGKRRTSRRRMEIFQASLDDGSGHLLITFFNQGYLEKVLTAGQEVVVFGLTRFDEYSGRVSMVNPEFELMGEEGNEGIHTGRIVPVYRKLAQLNSRLLRQTIHQVLDALKDTGADPLPEHLVQKYRFPPRLEALRQLHFPVCPLDTDRPAFLSLLNRRGTPPQQRFIYEELFVFQMGLQLVRSGRAVVEKPWRIRIGPEVRRTVKSILPFHPTQAQKRVLKEIVDDLTSPRAMSRLLQGDVGSGKTIVAVQAMLVVMENGPQAALMAPTEILAEQHFRSLQRLLAPTPYQAVLLTGRMNAKIHRSTLEKVEAGEVHLVVGTHALIQKKVRFHNLGFVVVDEQHRFGVMQRSQLTAKGRNPDLLVMTATPIPRSLALTVYGDLDLSVLDELPPGRKPVRTLIKHEKGREEVYAALRRQLERGHQIYVVYPLVEESEKVDLKAATEMARHLQEDILPQFKIGLIHGKLKSDEKETLMVSFSEGRIQVLVATTVIEVGIDVPNATVMVIEHAERFGLSQLHQLRGRIGRGSEASYCILMVSGAKTKEALQRLEIMRNSNDGFQIAEKDLEIRGPGDFLGTRQSGLPEFQFAHIVRDRKWLETARQDACRCLDQYTSGPGRNTAKTIRDLTRLWKEKYGVYEVG